MDDTCDLPPEAVTCQPEKMAKSMTDFLDLHLGLNARTRHLTTET